MRVRNAGGSLSEGSTRRASGKEPENIDKEFLRLWFKDRCDPYKDEKLPGAQPSTEKRRMSPMVSFSHPFRPTAPLRCTAACNMFRHRDRVSGVAAATAISKAAALLVALSDTFPCRNPQMRRQSS